MAPGGVHGGVCLTKHLIWLHIHSRLKSFTALRPRHNMEENVITVCTVSVQNRHISQVQLNNIGIGKVTLRNSVYFVCGIWFYSFNLFIIPVEVWLYCRALGHIFKI